VERGIGLKPSTQGPKAKQALAEGFNPMPRGAKTGGGFTYSVIGYPFNTGQKSDFFGH